MAQINFPNSPTDGQEFIASNTLYTYVLAKNLWKATSLGGGSGGGSGSTSFVTLTDVGLTDLSAGDLIFYDGTFFANTDLKYRQIAFSAASAYTLSTQSANYKVAEDPNNSNNPMLSAFAGTTMRLDLNTTGDAVRIQDYNGNDYNNGLVHVSDDGTQLEGISAQGKTSGSLYWKIPVDAAGTYVYQSEVRSSMKGYIKVKGAGNEATLSMASLGGSLEIDLAASNVFALDLNSNVTNLTLSNAASAGSTITLVITNSGTYDITWPGQIIWAQGSPPTLTTSGKDIITLLSVDGGTVFYGFVAGQNFS